MDGSFDEQEDSSSITRVMPINADMFFDIYGAELNTVIDSQ